MLVLARRPSESIHIGEDIKIVVLNRHADQVSIGIIAPEHIPVHREEIYERLFKSSAAMHACSTYNNAKELS